MSALGSVRKDLKWTWRPLSQDAFSGYKVAVIGGTNGIGRALAHVLAMKGAEVWIVGRTFRDHDLPRVHFIQTDLSAMKNVRKIARDLPAETLDILIMTQGIFAGSKRRASTEGIELDMAVSALSRFVLVRELADQLGKNRSKGKPSVFVWGFPGKDRKATLNDFNLEFNYVWHNAHSNGVVVNETLVIDSAARHPKLNF
jgi:NAD(P)-dependent dehydrogenase (short-subunit alcohol dehydrogenase family)